MTKYAYVCPDCGASMIVRAHDSLNLPFLTKCRATAGCKGKAQKTISLREEDAPATHQLTEQGIRGVV